MRAKLMLLGNLLLGLFLAGCSSGGAEPTSDTSDMLTFTAEPFNVGTGDVFECFYTATFTDRDLAVWGASGNQGPGGHHILAYYTTDPQPVQHHPCKDSEMITWHQIAGSANHTGEAMLGLHDNLAIKVPKGVQLVLQSHYINTTGHDYTSQDSLSLLLLKPDQVSDYVNYFAVPDEKFDVPPQAVGYSSTTYCKVGQDLQIVLTLGHEHEHGTHYKLDEVDTSGNTLRTLRDDPWQPDFTSHPLISYYPKADPLIVKTGSILKQTCTWNNNTANDLVFPREMCVGFTYYFPGDGDIVCDLTSTP